MKPARNGADVVTEPFGGSRPERRREAVHLPAGGSVERVSHRQQNLAGLLFVIVRSVHRFIQEGGTSPHPVDRMEHAQPAAPGLEVRLDQRVRLRDATLSFLFLDGPLQASSLSSEQTCQL